MSHWAAELEPVRGPVRRLLPVRLRRLHREDGHPERPDTDVDLFGPRGRATVAGNIDDDDVVVDLTCSK